MKTKILLASIAMMALLQMQGQSLSPQIVSTGGSFHERIGLVHEFTIGEVMVASLQSPSGKCLTQGFLQPSLFGTVGFSAPLFDYKLEAFPNPVSVHLNLRSDFLGELTFRLHSITGKLITQGLWSQEETINFSELPPGSYILYELHSTRLVQSDIIIKN